MPKLRRTLLIGLGGTGIRTILNAKKMFYENYGEIPPMIGFLGIDTNAPEIETIFVTAKDGTKISLSQSEQLKICVDEPGSIYTQNMDRSQFDWLPKTNISSLTTLDRGAGQIRSNGRFAATVCERLIENSLTRKMTEVNDAQIIDNDKYSLLGAETEVHMAFSIGGGTGCGTFINIAYLIKRIFPKVKLSGYAVLAKVFRLMAPGASTSRVYSNATGAIMDLDYLAHLELDSKPVEVKWLNKTDQIVARPFNALYLIDNSNSNSDTFDKIEPLCEMVSLAIVTSVGEVGVGMASIADNVDKCISDRSMDVRNKKAWIAGMGCTEILFDGTRLANIYAYKAGVQIINAMLNGGCDDPVNIANNWFDTNTIRENLGKDDVIDYFMSAASPYVFSDLSTPEAPEPECRHFIDNRAVEKNETLNKKLAALKNRINTSLTELIQKYSNVECGVALSNDILHSILHIIELCDGEMKDELEQLNDRLPAFDSALTSRCNELANCMSTIFKLHKKERINDVCESTMKLTVQLREIKRRQYARQFYAWLREQCINLINEIDKIMQNLRAVKSEFNQQAIQLAHTGCATSFFQIDLSETEAENITCPGSDIVFNDFALKIAKAGGVMSIAGKTTEETARLIHSYALTLPNTVKYEGTTVDEIINSLSETQFKEMTERAIQKSLPLLPYSFRGYQVDLITHPVNSYYIGVSNAKTSRFAKGNAFKNLVPHAEQVDFTDTGLKDRVIIYHQLYVLPAFTIKALDDYKFEYERAEKDRPHSSHWDEHMINRMEKERFNLMPGDPVSEAKVLEVWVKAIIYDLVSYNAETGQYQIKSRGLGGKPLDDWLVDMGPSRIEAYNYFTDNFDVLSQEIKATLEKLDVPGPDNTIRINSARAIKAAENNTYLSEISKCPISMDNIRHYPEDKKLIENEIEFILDKLINL